MKPGFAARLPIGVKLPLVAGVLVLFVCIALTSAGYVAARRLKIEDTRVRLGQLTQTLATTYRTSISQLELTVRAAARDTTVRRYLEQPTPERRRRLLGVVAFPGPQSDQTMAVEIRDAEDRLLWSTGKDSARLAVAVAPGWVPHPDEADTGAVGKFQRLSDSTIMIPAVARIPGDPEAYLVLWRRTATQSRVQEQAQRIIGSGANILFGNADRSLWTDFASPIAPPPVDLSSQDGMFRYDRAGARGRVLATAVHLPRTPWAMVVEFPMRDVLAPVYAFLRQMIFITALCVLLGVLAAWALGRRTTAPLGRLAEAADAFARGDLRHRVNLNRADELGQVGASFDSMAAEVAEARQRLEEKVAARTAQLERTQEALVRREKLAALGELSGGVSHELRTPLAAMSNAVRLLETLQPEAPEQVRRAHQMLRDQLALAQRIIRDMLDFSRITPAERLPVPLRDLAQTQLARLGAPQGIVVLQEFPDSLPLVHVDPVHAGQVVLNLLTNAVQAMGNDGGTLHLRGRLVDQETVLLEVTDTGPGVPPEHLDKIFEPLFTTKEGGIGLGLAVSKSLALANGGDLAVINLPGKGATFAFAMPTVI